MKKRIWFSILPVVLLCAMLWTRRESWKRTDAEFRQVMFKQAKEGSKAGVMVSIGTPKVLLDLGVLKTSQLEHLLSDVHLQSAVKDTFDISEFLINFKDYSNNSRDIVNLSLALDGERNYISTIDTSGDSMLQKWNDFELTPDSVRLLKKRVMALYGKQIEDFKHTPLT